MKQMVATTAVDQGALLQNKAHLNIRHQPETQGHRKTYISESLCLWTNINADRIGFLKQILQAELHGDQTGVP